MLHTHSEFQRDGLAVTALVCWKSPGGLSRSWPRITFPGFEIMQRLMLSVCEEYTSSPGSMMQRKTMEAVLYLVTALIWGQALSNCSGS